MHDVVVTVFLTLLSHCYNEVRGHRTGSSNSGVEDYTITRCVSTSASRV